MDGFYVCKIQKLSDMVKSESEESQLGTEEPEKDIDKEMSVEKSTPSKSKGKSSDKVKAGKKKRSSTPEKSPRSKKPKTEKVSIPPSTNNKKGVANKKNSAKTTKVDEYI